MLHTAFIILISQAVYRTVSNAADSLQGFFGLVFIFTPTQSTVTVPFLDCKGKNEHSMKFESQQPSIGQRTSRNSTATSKAMLPTIQPRYHTQIPPIKGKFYKDIRDIFLERPKNATYLGFPLI